jgi:hypothetical protein
MLPGEPGWDAFVVRYARRGSAGLNANDTRVSAITLTLGVTDTRKHRLEFAGSRVESPRDPVRTTRPHPLRQAGTGSADVTNRCYTAW